MRRVVKEKQRVSGDSRDTKQIRGRAAAEKCVVAEAGNRISALKVYDSFFFRFIRTALCTQYMDVFMDIYSRLAKQGRGKVR